MMKTTSSSSSMPISIAKSEPSPLKASTVKRKSVLTDLHPPNHQEAAAAAAAAAQASSKLSPTSLLRKAFFSFRSSSSSSTTTTTTPPLTPIEDNDDGEDDASSPTSFSSSLPKEASSSSSSSSTKENNTTATTSTAGARRPSFSSSSRRIPPGSNSNNSPRRRGVRSSSASSSTAVLPASSNSMMMLRLPPVDRSFQSSMNLLRHVQDAFGQALLSQYHDDAFQDQEEHIPYEGLMGPLWKQRGLVQATLGAMHEFPRTTAIQDMGLIALHQALESLYYPKQHSSSGRMSHLLSTTTSHRNESHHHGGACSCQDLVNQLLDTMTIHSEQESIQEGCLLCLATLLTTNKYNPEAEMDDICNCTSQMLVQSPSSLRLLVLCMKRFRSSQVTTIQISGIHILYMLSKQEQHRPQLLAAKVTGPLFAAYFLGLPQKSLASRFAERVLANLIQDDDDSSDGESSNNHFN